MKAKKVKTRTIIISILIIIVFFAMTSFFVNYFVGKNNEFSKISNKVFPFPVAVVDFDNFLSAKILQDNLESSKRFYENQDFSNQGFRIDFSTEDGKKRLAIKEKNILNKMIEDAIVEKMLDERGIRITDEMISQEVERKISEIGNKTEIQERLFKLYGWNLEKFKERIVRPDLNRERLTEEFLNDQGYLKNFWDKIKLAQQKVEENKKFEDVAKEFSEGESAKNGGDLGWLSKEQILPELSDIIFKMEKGEISGIIQSQLGLHIIRINDKKVENETPMISVSQIFVRTPTLSDWLTKNSQDISVNLMIHDFIWNKDEMILEFRDKKMKEFEKEVETNFQGDISVIF